MISVVSQFDFVQVPMVWCSVTWIPFPWFDGALLGYRSHGLMEHYLDTVPLVWCSVTWIPFPWSLTHFMPLISCCSSRRHKKPLLAFSRGIGRGSGTKWVKWRGWKINLWSTDWRNSTILVYFMLKNGHNTEKCLKYVRPFFNIMNERVKKVTVTNLEHQQHHTT